VCVAAIAATEPKEISALVAFSKFSDDDKAIVSMACDINEGGHSDPQAVALSSGGLSVRAFKSPRIIQGEMPCV
jgi:hypothetical protein